MQDYNECVCVCVCVCVYMGGINGRLQSHKTNTSVIPEAPEDRLKDQDVSLCRLNKTLSGCWVAKTVKGPIHTNFKGNVLIPRGVPPCRSVFVS